MKAKKKVILGLALVLCVAVLVVCVVAVSRHTQLEANGIVWEKSPDTFSWEEYEKLTQEQKNAFRAWFETEEAYEEWKNSALAQHPGDTDEKSLEEYTWEDFEKMTPDQQEAFSVRFESSEAFQKWMDEAMPPMPWEQGGKTPEQYTWEEYRALTLEQQERFFNWFASEEAFVHWKESVNPEETLPSFVWDVPGKKPDAYTWEEFSALSVEQQEAFYQWFSSEEAFETWLKNAKPAEDSTVQFYWNEPGKTPDKYTMEEYNALSPEKREAFYQWFGSKEAFENWMTKALADAAAAEFVWDKPGKTPDQYTWEEYYALSSEDQEAFYQWFGSMEAFEKWMKSVKPDDSTLPDLTWNETGKSPDAYTWEEYQELSPEKQEAFYQWFGSREAFEAWMAIAKPKEAD